jgi:hypothetical protein
MDVKHICTETPSSYRSYSSDMAEPKSTYEGWRSGGKPGEFSRFEGLAFLSGFEFTLNGTRPNVRERPHYHYHYHYHAPTRSSDSPSGGPYRISLIAFLTHVTNRKTACCNTIFHGSIPTERCQLGSPHSPLLVPKRVDNCLCGACHVISGILHQDSLA